MLKLAAVWVALLALPAHAGPDSFPVAPDTSKYVRNLKVGDRFPLEDLKHLAPLVERREIGKPTVIVFWAHWCPYCRKQLAFLDTLYRNSKQNGFQVVGVTSNEERMPSEAKARELAFPNLTEEKGELYSKLGINGVPISFVLDENARVTSIIPGSSSGSMGPIRDLATRKVMKK